MQYIKLITVCALVAILAASCDRPGAAPAAEQAAVITHVDSITVHCDEAFQYLIGQEVAIYEESSPGNHIHVIYEPEAEVLRVLYTDSFSTVILGRRLRDSEREDIFAKGRLQVEERSFARDAIAIVASPSFEHDTLPYEQIAALISNSSQKYKLVFQGNGSGVVSYMFAQFARGTRPSAFAAKNTTEMIGYLQKDNKAIGFIPFDQISDDDKADARDLLKKVKVLSVSRADSAGRMSVTTASQSEIADGSYPFSRSVTFIQHSMDQKVGTGFVNFLNHDRSGRIILKTGLVPAIMPSRVVNINTDGVK